MFFNMLGGHLSVCTGEACQKHELADQHSQCTCTKVDGVLILQVF